jgi:hypothetical protein
MSDFSAEMAPKHLDIEYSKPRLLGRLRTTSRNRWRNSSVTARLRPGCEASINPRTPSDVYRCSHRKTVTELSRTISAISSTLRPFSADKSTIYARFRTLGGSVFR